MFIYAIERAQYISVVCSFADLLVLQIGPSDQLSAPSHFPPAVFSYTVKEMSVAWHLYGGRDFGATPTRDQKKRYLPNFEVSWPRRRMAAGRKKLVLARERVRRKW